MFYVVAGDGEKGVEIHIPRSKSHDEIMSIRVKFAVMRDNVCCAIEKSLRLGNLKMFLKVAYRIDGNAKLDNCDSVQSVMELITDKECSLTDITLLEVVAKHFEVIEAEKYIEMYKSELKQFYESLSVSLCLKEKIKAIETSSLKNETVTYVLDWRPDEKELKDITDILAKISGKLVKIKYIDTN